MTRETQKQTIERLTEEVETLRSELHGWKTLVDGKDREILEIIKTKDDIFKGSSDYEQMKKRIAYIELKNKSLEDTIDYNNKLQKVINENKVHNERGAGRKSKFTDLEKETMKMYRL